MLSSKREWEGVLFKLIPGSPSELAVTLAGTGDAQLVLAPGEAHYLNGGGQTHGMLVALAERGWGPHTSYCLSPGPLPSAGQAAPVLWALHGPAHHPRPTLSTEPPWPGSCPWVGAGPTHRLPRVSLYTAGRPASEWDWVSSPWGRGGSCSPSHVDPGNFSFPQVGTIPERPGWSGAPSPQASEMRGGRSPRPGGCSPSLIDGFEGGAGEGHRSWADLPGLACHCLEQWLSSCPQPSFFFLRFI